MPPTVLLLLPALLAGNPGALEVSREALLMGSFLRVSLAAPDRVLGLALAGEALAAVARVEARLSTWRPESEVSELNRAPVGVPVALSEESFLDLQEAYAIAERSAYAFDPGIGALTRALGVPTDEEQPGRSDPRLALAAVGSGAFLLDARAQTLCRLSPAARLDTGGFGKGAGLDAAIAALRSRSVPRAQLDFGGQISVLGLEQTIEIAHPRERGRPVARLRLRDASIATSGNGEWRGQGRGSEAHLAAARSAGWAQDFGSVSVVSRSGLAADALATALFVLGPDLGLVLAEQEPGVEAVFCVLEDDGVTLLATSGLAQELEPVGERVKLRSHGLRSSR